MIEDILRYAEIIGAIAVIVGIVIGAYKFYRANQRQTECINKMQAEQTLICYGVLCCLKGLKEQGVNGPVTTALDKIEKHLNESAHPGI